MVNILNAFGWEEISSRNKYMKSFKKDMKRMNIYYTTGTVTIQDERGILKTFRNIITDEDFEKVVEHE
jgi:hypothetical protein